MSTSPQFELTPKEDLVLLTTKHNHPQFSWQQISDHILRHHCLLIPSDVCRNRFEDFLCIIPQRHIEIAHKWPLAEEWSHPSLRRTIPQNFIFAYKEIRNSATQDKESTVKLSCLERYQKRLVSQLLGCSKNYGKTKAIQKMKREISSYSCRQIEKRQQQIQQLVDHVYFLIKQSCEPNGVLTQQIAQQKIQLLLSQMLQEINEKILAVQQNSKETIKNGLELIRSLKQQCLRQERYKIFDIYFKAIQIDIEICSNIKQIFRTIQQAYLSSQTSKSSKAKQFQYPDTLQQITQTCSSQSLICQQAQICNNLDVKSGCDALNQKQTQFNQRVPDFSINQSNQSMANPQQSHSKVTRQQATNSQVNSISHFQIIISNKITSISNNYQLKEQIQVKQQPQTVQECTVKQEDTDIQVKYEERQNKKKRKRRNMVPKGVGKVWIILND